MSPDPTEGHGRTATRLVLIRHARRHDDSSPDDPRLIGRTDAPLSEEGEEQARRLADRLARESVDAVYSSPLQRAMRTAAPIADASRLPVETDPGLAEIDCGQADGLLASEARRRFPSVWDATFSARCADLRWPGGESYAEFRRRCLGSLSRIAEELAGRRVIAVTHAGVISQVVGWMSGEGPERWDRHRPGEASLTEVVWDGAASRLVVFDDRRHLG